LGEPLTGRCFRLRRKEGGRDGGGWCYLDGGFPLEDSQRYEVKAVATRGGAGAGGGGKVFWGLRGGN